MQFRTTEANLSLPVARPWQFRVLLADAAEGTKGRDWRSLKLNEYSSSFYGKEPNRAVVFVAPVLGSLDSRVFFTESGEREARPYLFAGFADHDDSVLDIVAVSSLPLDDLYSNEEIAMRVSSHRRAIASCSARFDSGDQTRCSHRRPLGALASAKACRRSWKLYTEAIFPSATSSAHSRCSFI